MKSADNLFDKHRSRETPTPIEPSKWTPILPSLSKSNTSAAHMRTGCCLQVRNGRRGSASRLQLNGLGLQAYLADILARIHDQKTNRLDELCRGTGRPWTRLRKRPPDLLRLQSGGYEVSHGVVSRQTAQVIEQSFLHAAHPLP